MAQFRKKKWLAGGMLVAVLGSAWAQQGIFTCVDAKGRRLTSDRPIAECNDREQKELSSTGTVRRTVKPVMTAEELAREEARQKAEAEEKARQAEQRRRERALLTRYPNREAHDKARADAMLSVDEVIKAANKRLLDLAEQRKKTEAEFEFYRKDPAKAPASLKRQIEENASAAAAQKRFIAAQDDEKRRINTRFDEELARLQPLWAAAGR